MFKKTKLTKLYLKLDKLRNDSFNRSKEYDEGTLEHEYSYARYSAFHRSCCEIIDIMPKNTAKYFMALRKKQIIKE
jgi:hypothetical protein